MQKTHHSKQINLSEIAFYGRFRLHYQEMFGLDAEQLRGKKVLDIATGPSLYPDNLWRKFNVDFTAVDPAYAQPEKILLKRSNKDAVKVTDAFKGSGALSPLLENKLRKDETLHQTIGFLSSLAREFQAQQPDDAPLYVADKLPYLNQLGEERYDLVTCGHFLFAYYDPELRPWLNKEYHRKALERLIQLCDGEIRIYPIKTLNGQPIPFLNTLLSSIQAAGHHVCIEPVPHAHVNHWNEMLRIIPKHSRKCFDVIHTKEELWGDQDPWDKIYS